MTEPRKLKKSETLEIRLPHPTKEAFMAQCRTEGRSASEALRAFIDGSLEAPVPRRGERRWLRFALGGLIAAAVGAVAVPSLARPGPAEEFLRLDANQDGRLDLSEFARLDRNGDGRVSLDEYRR